VLPGLCDQDLKQDRQGCLQPCPYLAQKASYHAAEGDHTHPVIFPCGPAAALAKAQSASSSLVDQDFTGYA
jgi:hypothetical protein